MKFKKTNIYITGNKPAIENVTFGKELTVTKEVTDTEENKAYTWYKITGKPNSTKTSKISFTTAQDNVNISFKIKSSSESGFDYVYLTEIDSANTQYNSSIVNKVSGYGTEKVVDYTVKKAGDHYIYVCYRKDGSGNAYNDCGYVCLLTKIGIPVTEIKSVYVENSKVQQMNVKGKNLFEYVLGNTISWETLTWDKNNNTYTYNSKGPLKMEYKNLGSSTLSSISLNNSPAEMPNNGQIDNIKFDNGQSDSIRIMPYKIDLSDWDSTYVTNMGQMFYDCRSLASLDVSNLNVGNVTNMGTMFYWCRSLTSFDVSKWNVGNVISMDSMFSGCSSLTSLDVSKWNVSKVTNMNSMFYGCSKLTSLDVSNWNVSSVNNMYSMFNWCSGLTS